MFPWENVYLTSASPTMHELHGGRDPLPCSLSTQYIQIWCLEVTEEYKEKRRCCTHFKDGNTDPSRNQQSPGLSLLNPSWWQTFNSFTFTKDIFKHTQKIKHHQTSRSHRLPSTATHFLRFFSHLPILPTLVGHLVFLEYFKANPKHYVIYP